MCILQSILYMLGNLFAINDHLEKVYSRQAGHLISVSFSLDILFFLVLHCLSSCFFPLLLLLIFLLLFPSSSSCSFCLSLTASMPWEYLICEGLVCRRLDQEVVRWRLLGPGAFGAALTQGQSVELKKLLMVCFFQLSHVKGGSALKSMGPRPDIWTTALWQWSHMSDTSEPHSHLRRRQAGFLASTGLRRQTSRLSEQGLGRWYEVLRHITYLLPLILESVAVQTQLYWRRLEGRDEGWKSRKRAILRGERQGRERERVGAYLHTVEESGLQTNVCQGAKWNMRHAVRPLPLYQSWPDMQAV